MKSAAVVVLGIVAGCLAGMVMLPKSSTADKPAIPLPPTVEKQAAVQSQPSVSKVQGSEAALTETSLVTSEPGPATSESVELPRIVSTSTILGRPVPTGPPTGGAVGVRASPSPAYPPPIQTPRARQPVPSSGGQRC